jgi:hypothetical protein
MPNAKPRMARLTHVSSNPNRPVIAARIYDGPASELGKIVHIPITRGDIPEIRAFLDKLEERDA